MSETESRAGSFWSPDIPDRRGHGEWSVTSTECVIDVTSQILIVPSHRISPTERGYCITDSAVGVAKDHAPRVVWGELSDGEAVSLLDAQMYLHNPFLEMSREVFTGARLVRGAHVRASDFVTGVRWNLNLDQTPAWMRHDAVVTTAGELAPWVAGSSPGFSLELAEPEPLREAADRWPSRVTSLVTLGMAEEASVLTREVRLPDGTWHPYGLPERKEGVGDGELLQAYELGMPVVARWVDKLPQLGRYPFVASQDVGPVEVAGQVYATALEGLHRLLHPRGTLFPGVSQNALNRARRAGVRAAADHLLDNEGWSDRDVAEKVYRGALSKAGQPDYAARLTQLLEPLFGLLPPMFGGDLPRWVDLSRRIRNDESHGLNGGGLLGEADYGRYIVLQRTARWALRLVLLLEVFDESVLLEAVGRSSAFWYLLANVDAEGIWKDYCCTDAFIQMNQDRLRD